MLINAFLAGDLTKQWADFSKKAADLSPSVSNRIATPDFRWEISLDTRKQPSYTPSRQKQYLINYTPSRQKQYLINWPTISLGGFVLAGLYMGFFTPTEAGAVGALGALLFGLVNGGSREKGSIKASLRESAATTSMLIFIIVTAMVFSRFLALTRAPMEFAQLLVGWDVNQYIIMLSILLLWFVLGMFMAQAAVFALTLPILFPVVVKLGIDPIWFSVIAMKLNEIAGVSPPVGLNAFGLVGSLSGEHKDVTIADAYYGCMPFILCDILVIILLFIFPEIATFLPYSMFGKG